MTRDAIRADAKGRRGDGARISERTREIMRRTDDNLAHLERPYHEARAKLERRIREGI